MVSEEISTSQKLSGEINVAIVLEEAIISQPEWMVHLCEDQFLVLNMIDMLARDDFVLFH